MLNKSDPPADKKEPVVIKKYANRRLYNTETSTYVTLDDLAAMVKGERDFVVFDAKTGDDLTHSVLTQIIVDQEHQKGTETLLPIPFLRQLIRFYGASIERFVPSYLQISLETLAKEQDRYRKQFAGAFTPAGAFEAYQEQARKNLAMFEQAMAMFSPFGAIKVGAGAKPGEEAQEARAAQVTRQACREDLRAVRRAGERDRRAQGAARRLSSLSSRSSPTIGSSQRSALGCLLLGRSAQSSAPPMERSRRATRMPMVKPATTSISEATMTRKNTDVAAWFDHQELDDAGDEHHHRQAVIDQRDGAGVGGFHELGEQHHQRDEQDQVAPREGPRRAAQHRQREYLRA